MIEKGRLTPAEPTSSASAGNSNPATGIIPANVTITTPGPKQKARNLAAQHQLAETPHNTAAAQSHVIAVLDELDSLVVQGVPISAPIRNRVLQLGNLARMTMAQEVIQLETNRQLRQNNRKKGQKKEGDSEAQPEAPMPGLRTALVDKGTRVLTIEVADELKKKAEAKFEAELEPKLHLDNKRKKAFCDAMIASPLGGLCEAASVAEHEGETEITIDVSLRWRVEAIKAEYFVTPGSTVEFRLEDYEAGPMP